MLGQISGIRVVSCVKFLKDIDLSYHTIPLPSLIVIEEIQIFINYYIRFHRNGVNFEAPKILALPLSYEFLVYVPTPQ